MSSNPTLFEDAFRRHIAAAEASLQSLIVDIDRSAGFILEAIKGGGKILVCGNGGSAADSQHFATELVCRYKDNRRPLNAKALTTDTSLLTAISNDYSFDQIFSRQIEALGEKGDLLVAISTSGQSPNIIQAIEKAKNLGVKTILLTSNNPKAQRNIADVEILVPIQETARVQEIHEIIIHSWCEFIDLNLKDENQ